MAARPTHFLVRPDVRRQTVSGVAIEPGSIVPLIAVDQLPAWLEIVGIPRQLTVEQTVGLSNLGIVTRGSTKYDVKIHWSSHQPADPTTQALGRTHDDGTQNASVTHLSSHPVADSSGIASPHGRLQAGPPNPTEPAHLADRMMAHDSRRSSLSPRRQSHCIPAANLLRPSSATTGAVNVSPNSNQLLPLPLSPHHKYLRPLVVGVKGPAPHFCRHWCHHGTCKWGSYCRYAHRMPATASELEEVGLKAFPAWWTVAVAIAEGCDLRQAGQRGWGLFGGRTAMKAHDRRHGTELGGPRNDERVNVKGARGSSAADTAQGGREEAGRLGTLASLTAGDAAKGRDEEPQHSGCRNIPQQQPEKLVDL